MAERTPLQQFLYDTGIAAPGDVERRAREIESSDWLAGNNRQIAEEVIDWIHAHLPRHHATGDLLHEADVHFGVVTEPADASTPEVGR